MRRTAYRRQPHVRNLLRRGAVSVSVAWLVLTAGPAPTHADLAGTTIDVTLVQVHPQWPYSVPFTHTYGSTSTISDPLFPQFPIDVTTPGGAAGFDHSLVVDFSQNQYGDFTGFTGEITLANIDEPVDPASPVLLDENGVSIGSVTGAGGTINGTWAVDEVLAAGTGTRLVVAWNSVSGIATQPAMGEPLTGLTPAELARFDAGTLAFTRSFTAPEGLGPIFNKESCANCHSNPIGASGTQTVTRFGLSDKGTFTPLDTLGGSLLQVQAIDPGCLEVVPPEANVTSLRVTNGALGYGLVEAIEDADLLALEQPPPGISGRAHMVEALETPGVPRVGRFGWKAQVPTVLTFSADAALNEMGITNRLLMQENDPNGIMPPDLSACDTVPDPEDGPDGQGFDFIDRVTDFQRFLAPPPQTPLSGMTGETLFGTVGCDQCHTPAFTTSSDPTLEAALRSQAIRPYSDFLLHDMGLAADFIAQGDAGEREVRTPPLWGLLRRDPLWHDGRFGGGTFDDRVTAAIIEHGVFGSEAESVTDAFVALTAPDRTQLLDFLASLGRREFDGDADHDIDLDDFIVFETCFTGPGGAYSPDDPCAVNDIDRDGDVDLDDYDQFALVYEGPQTDCNNNGFLDVTDIIRGISPDTDLDGTPDECECSTDCAVPADGVVDVTDLLALLAQWNQPAASCDTDFSGVVDIGDLLAVLAEWGGCP